MTLVDTPIALITGATDGIGKALAIKLAQRGYTIHAIGRNSNKGEILLDELKAIAPYASHRLYLVDLSSLKENRNFLTLYRAEQNKLNLLVLNANALPKAHELTEDGFNRIFSISFLSRFLFSHGLKELLNQSNDARILHICGSVLLSPVDYKKVYSESLSPLKATAMGSWCNHLIAYHQLRNLSKNVRTEVFDPGIVHTNTVKSQNFLIRLLSRLMGMKEPSIVAESIACHLESIQVQSHSTYLFGLNGEKKIPSPIKNSESSINNLNQWALQVSGAGV